jgi:hypothetical protein
MRLKKQNKWQSCFANHHSLGAFNEVMHASAATAAKMAGNKDACSRFVVDMAELLTPRRAFY